MKRFLICTAAAALLAAGCTARASAPVCPPVENGVGVCLNGQAVTWHAKYKAPHMHESGGYYAPVEQLQQLLGVKADIAPDRKNVRVNGTAVIAGGQQPKGIHDHETHLFAPIREFAEAAGYQVMVDTERHTVSIIRK